MEIKGKIALITGGSSGIGLATAKELLQNGLCHVILTGIDPCQGKEACKQLTSLYGSNKCSYTHLNVISDKQFNKVLSRVKDEFGTLDILFNNAGIFEDKKWELEVETNFKSMIRANLLGLKYMSNQNKSLKPESIIINNADVCALEPLPSAPVYSATKGGIINITKCFGSKYHYKKSGVRVVAICCGATDTDLIKSVATKQLNDEWGEHTFHYVTRKRLLKPAVVGRGVTYLVKYAPTNTIWSIEDSQLYLSDIPHKSTYNIRVTHL
ncbi:15-hydroxyprostaglandin dehydrogenase [NAD(+)]-like [Lycorma delicatula]|uniref:15-hydroxyprostaglandin dehydrogenase [NAD(+)]-like n=1 Tax=Lycorma delicatula TaxID=130591 RepID=UPI003F513640